MRRLLCGWSLLAASGAALLLGDVPAAFAENEAVTAAGACAAGDALYDARLLTQARASYVTALQLGGCASGQKQIPLIGNDQSKAQIEYEAGLAARADDDDKAATDAFTAALALDAGFTAARRQLREMASETAPPPKDRWQTLGKRADDAWEDLKDAGKFAAVYGGIAAVAILALLLLARLPPIRSAGRRFGELAKTRPGSYSNGFMRFLVLWWWRRLWYGIRSGARWLFGASVRVEADDNDEELRTTVQGMIGGTAGLADAGVDVSSGQAGSDLVDDLAAALKDVPQGKLLAALIPLLRTALPRDAYFVRLKPIGGKDEAQGIAVTLAGRRSIVRAADTLWEADFNGGHDTPDGEQAVPVLAIATASWADYAVMGLRNRLDFAQSVRGTRDARSHALFRVGLEHQRAGRFDVAQTLYAQALDVDPTNWPARFNLGVCDNRRGERQQAQARFETVVAAAREPDPSGFKMRNPLWYSAVYNLAATYVMCSPTLTAKAREELLPMLKELADARYEASLIAGQRSQRAAAREAARDRVRLLERVLDPALVMWSDLAGVTAQRAKAAVDAPDALARLCDLLEGASVQELPDNAAAILSFAARRSVSARTAYNLACLFTRLNNHGYALRYLRDAAEVPDLATWAQLDPSLDALRLDPGFADAVAGRVQPDSGLELAGLRPIGPTNAQLLGARGIVSSALLVARCATTAARSALATALGVSPALVERWARLAEVVKAAQLKPAEANLLDASAHGTLKTLRSATATQLQPYLADLHAIEAVGLAAPTLAQVQAWIEAADEADPSVQPL